MKIIDLSKTVWISDNKNLIVSEMHTSHIIRAMAFCQNRLESAKSIENLVPVQFRDELQVGCSGKSYAEWLEIFSAVLNERAAKENEARVAELKNELDKLMPPEVRAKELVRQIKAIKPDFVF